MRRTVGDWMRLLMVGACIAACMLVAAGAIVYAVVEDLRAIAEANPDYVRATGEADILHAAADAVRADTRIASWAPVLLWLALVGGLAFDATLAALAAYVWRLNWAAGKER